MKYQRWNVSVALGQYKNGRIALRLVHEDSGEPIAPVTVNLPGYTPPSDRHVLVREWGGTEGMAAWLAEQGLARPTGVELPTGYVTTKEIELLFDPEDASGLPAGVEYLV